MDKKLRLFRCTNCGHEVYLQAWKAECPSCRSGFTLVIVASEEKRARPPFLGYVPPILAGAYLLLTIFNPSTAVARLLPWPLPIIAPLAALTLSLTSSTLGNLSAAGLGAALTIVHLVYPGQQPIVETGGATLLAALAATSIINEVSIRRMGPRSHG
ncbi:hypothetical protein HRbin02_01503 [Candidatus Calditenuaceae archaeon HR02]|nr:hypothetical protein HRbin02_01503 [Candidatus Calditenuaceae archaeon HR02]